MPITILLSNFFQNIWAWINQVDTFLFLQINTVYTNSFLDTVYPWYREGNAWVPLYLFMIIFAIQNFPKKAFAWILFVVVTLILTDQISSSWVKPFFQRSRPCNDPLIMSQVRLLLDHCSGGFSFTSSHATNHFGFAVFLYMTMGPVIGKWKYALLVWAASISYGQIYVGVHYPLDILCGAILGSCIGFATAHFYLRRTGPLLA
ncbi:MAG: phosphatase PAP2 family protein [Sediminibacterium sp.]|nr:phosphatase PAP2 family protein [Sediminibacterium sp.]